MSHKSKTLIVLSVVTGVLLAVGVKVFVQGRSETAEEAMRKMLRHFEEESKKMGATKDSNGVWSFRSDTNTQPPPPK